MALKEELLEFTKEALVAGRSRSEIAQALGTAGWSEGEVGDALAAFADTPFVPPVPRPRAVVTARDFFVYALTFAALLTASICLIGVLVNLIDVYFDAEGRLWNIQAVRSNLAGVIVAGPIYGWLTWREEQRVAREPGQSRSAIRKWMIYLMLLIAAVTFGGDLIVFLGDFLNGAATPAFTLKCAVVAVVAGSVFLFYYQIIRPDES